MRKVDEIKEYSLDQLTLAQFEMLVGNDYLIKTVEHFSSKPAKFLGENKYLNILKGEIYERNI